MVTIVTWLVSGIPLFRALGKVLLNLGQAGHFIWVFFKKVIYSSVPCFVATVFILFPQECCIKAIWASGGWGDQQGALWLLLEGEEEEEEPSRRIRAYAATWQPTVPHGRFCLNPMWNESQKPPVFFAVCPEAT